MATFFSPDRDRKRLEQELQTDEYRSLLTRLQREEPFLRQFPTWADVLAFMRTGTSHDPRKDEILRPILAAHSRDEDRRWRAVLLLIFWPGLRSIHCRKRHWDRHEPDELWQRIFWAFHQSVCRIDLEHRRDRLVQAIFNSTFHGVYEQYRCDWTRASKEIRSKARQIDAVADLRGIDLADIELRDMQEREVKRLRKHLEAGHITEADYLLIIGTRIYGRSLGDYARGVGLTREAAKKRRQRAEAVIRSFESGLR